MDDIREVEIRAVLHDGTEADRIVRVLEARGAARGTPVVLHDRYFCPSATTSLDEVEMHDVGSYALRVRTVRDGERERSELNVKVITSIGDHGAWREHQTEVADPAQLAAILTAVGFKEFLTVRKQRQTYTLADCVIALEDIADFGLGVEAEALVHPDRVPATKARLRALFEELGIDAGRIVNKSITNMLLHERAFR